MKYHIAWVAGLFSIFFLGTAAAQVVSDSINTTKPSFWAYDALHIPKLNVESGKPIVVAVVDDAFNLDHEQLMDFAFRNEEETVNGQDTDNNGVKDDIVGWDVGDSDNDVSVPKARSDFFYHGTMVAGIVARVAQQAFGKNASDIVKILPVKSLKDDDQRHDYTLGYTGVEYAVNAGADIVICAWGGGKFDQEKHSEVFKLAEEKGVMVLAAAGNFYSGYCDPPASIRSVLAIAAVDSSSRKMVNSNYGPKVELSAGGEFVYAAHPSGTNTYGYLDGTSSATALIGGCAAVLKAAFPKVSSRSLVMALKNTAEPIDQYNTTYTAGLGAGIPDLTKAIEYLRDEQIRANSFESTRPQGSIVLSKRSNIKEWTLKPLGGIEHFSFGLFGRWADDRSPIVFLNGDEVMASYVPSEFPPKLQIAASELTIQYDGKLGKEETEIVYNAVPIDSTRLYCEEYVLKENEQGSFGDGSRDEQYANRTSCKWLIKVPEGQNVRLEFDEFDTEAKKDFVYVFIGNGTQQESLMAKFTGSDLPPQLVVGANEVLIWFLSNGSKMADGWHLNFHATDESPGIKSAAKN